MTRRHTVTNPRTRFTMLAAGAAVALTALAVAVAGPSSSAGAAQHASKTTIEVRSSKLGRILVDSKHRTLYLFEKDKGTKSECSGACATNWPPLRASGKPTVGHGLSTKKVGTTKRSDGTRQVTYKGHPLYRFVKDTKPGATKGQGLDAFGAEWYVLSPAGSKVDKSTSTGGTSKPSSGGGY